jgi:aminoglycoside phosphotransferase family enzyme/predicted kinase
MHRAGTKVAPLDTALVEQLTHPAAFDYVPGRIHRIETHISWVVLTDRYAYKIKKPLVFDFLDFGSLSQRRFFCEEEIRLNKPWAPDIYLDVIPITDAGGQLRFGGDGEPVEYAVRMRRFDEQLRLDRQLAAGLLTVDDMRELGQEIAGRHAAASVAAVTTRERTLQMTVTLIRDNFTALEGQANADTLASLRGWTEAELESSKALIEQRFDAGFVRDCHGDLHLANLVRMPGGIRAFDCIEFNEDLRRIDTLCDSAFLVMDLVAKGRHDLAALFLNRYLEVSGDYAGVALLDLYFVYRSMVRAKVAAICAQECELQNERLRNLADADRYCRLALRQTWKPAPLLIVMSGLSGSGKSWVAGQLMAQLPAIRIRSDVERKRLFGIAETGSSESGVNAGIYAPHLSADVYAHLRATARSVLEARHNVIIDATFLRRQQRAEAMEFADRCGYAAILIVVQAPLTVMRERIRQRQQGACDASEAGLQVLERQFTAAEELAEWEQKRAFVYDNDKGGDFDALLNAIRGRAGEVLPTSS